MEHPILTHIRFAGFMPLGWFETNPADGLPSHARFVVLIGNAGPQMFRRFSRERTISADTLDDWTRTVVDSLADELDAEAIYPFDTPPRPFLTWARRAGAGHISPLGLNIHNTFGLWHAYRAALVFPVAFDIPQPSQGPSPCMACEAKPCLSSCPVDAFDGTTYKVETCVSHIASSRGGGCMENGCMARRACPVGQRFTYEPAQVRFHMHAFLKARQEAIQ